MARIGKDLTLAKTLLRNGELVAIPTETVYGLAANALREDAAIKIFEAKKRPQFDPLIVHVAHIQQLDNLVDSIPLAAQKLMDRFWPGPLTLLLKKKPIVPDLITSGLDTVGVRCPDHPLTHQLLSELEFPLAAPSANPFGYISPTTPQHVNRQLGNSIDYILDGGPCRVGLESTIVGFENGIVVHRLGGLSIEDLEAVVGPVKLELNSSSNPKAPGQLKSHYSPTKKLVFGKIKTTTQRTSQKVGVITFQSPVAVHADEQIILSPTGSLTEAAKNLFGALRQMDSTDVDIILAEPVPDIGLGRAINDRLKRAAAD